MEGLLFYNFPLNNKTLPVLNHLETKEFYSTNNTRKEVKYLLDCFYTYYNTFHSSMYLTWVYILIMRS